MPDELWNEVHDIVQETGVKTIPMEKKCKKAKWLSGEALQIAEKGERQKAKEKRLHTCPGGVSPEGLGLHKTKQLRHQAE